MPTVEFLTHPVTGASVNPTDLFEIRLAEQETVAYLMVVFSLLDKIRDTRAKLRSSEYEPS